MAKKLVGIVDFQVDFLDLKGSKLPIPGSKELIIPMTQYLINLDPEETEAVVFTKDWHETDFVERMADGTPFPSHCVKNTVGAELAVNPAVINPRIPVYTIYKNAFNTFEEEGLSIEGYGTMKTRDQFFSEMLQKGIKNIDVGGVATDICVDFFVRGAAALGFEVTVEGSISKGLFRQIEEMESDWVGIRRNV